MNFYYELTNLFAVPIFNTKINDITDQEKKLLFSEDIFREEYSKCWFSKNNYILDQEKYISIKNKIYTYFNFYVRNVLNVSEDIQFYMTNSWLVKHKKGDKAEQHIHMNSIISGILYLNVDENSGNIVFHRNLQDSIFGNLDLPVTNWNTYNSRTWKFIPENNSLFLFPSKLIHSTSESYSDIERYVLVFNFFIKGSFGENLSKLQI